MAHTEEQKEQTIEVVEAANAAPDSHRIQVRPAGEISTSEIPSAEIQSIHELTHAMKPARNCGVSWDTMQGDDSFRKCSRCHLYVLKPRETSESGLLQLLQDNRPSLSNDRRKQQLFRRADGTFTLGDCNAHRRPRPRTVAIVFLVPLAFVGYCYAMAPDHIIPFLNHPIMKIGLAILVGWHAIGCSLISRTTARWTQIVLLTVFCAPLPGFCMIGPAVIVILQAFGGFAAGK